jgi:hypothetical protein
MQWGWLARWAKHHPRGARRTRRLLSGEGPASSLFLITLMTCTAVLAFVPLGLFIVFVNGGSRISDWAADVAYVLPILVMAILVGEIKKQLVRLTPPRTSDVVREMAVRLQDLGRSLDQALDDVADLGSSADAMETRNVELEQQNTDLRALAAAVADSRTMRAWDRRSRRDSRRVLWWNFAQGGLWFALGIAATLVLQKLQNPT